jgi:amidophosphoribosyltransferase
VLLNVLASELQRVGTPRVTPADIFAAVTAVYRRCRGGYAVVAMVIGHGILGFRDPNGIRPLVLGRRETPKGPSTCSPPRASRSTCSASSWCATWPRARPCSSTRRAGCIRSSACTTARHTPCIFEFVYFARPDSIIDNISVQRARMRMGDKLADKIKRERPDHDIDVVIPIPDTSRTARCSSRRSSASSTARGSSRTATSAAPSSCRARSSAEVGARKLNAIDLEFRGKNVLLVDDSIVRGTTSAQIIELAREAGARHLELVEAGLQVPRKRVELGIGDSHAGVDVLHGAAGVLLGTAACVGDHLDQHLLQMRDLLRRGLERHRRSLAREVDPGDSEPRDRRSRRRRP